jgi:hypothetical protein
MYLVPEVKVLYHVIQESKKKEAGFLISRKLSSIMVGDITD